MGVRMEVEEDVLQMREEKKSRKRKKNESGTLDVMTIPRGATDVNVDDNGVESGKENKKKRDKEKKYEGSDELDFNVIREEISNDKDHVGAEDNKKRKSELKQDGKERKNDVEFIFMKDKKHRKKEKRNRVKENKVSDDAYVKAIEDKEAPNKKGHVGGENNKRCTDMRMDDKELENVVELDQTKDKKKKRNKDKENKSFSLAEILTDKEIGTNKEAKGLEDYEKNEFADKNEGEEGNKIKKNKKKKKERKEKVGGDIESHKMKSSNKVSTKGKKSIASDVEVGKEKDHVDEGCGEKVEYAKEERKKRKKDKNGVEAYSRDIITEKSGDERKATLEDKEVADNGHSGLRSKKRDREKEVVNVEMEKGDKYKRKKTKLIKDSRNSESGEPSKRVKFSDHVEVFPLSDVMDVGEENEEEGLVRGKRFSQEEDEKVKDSVLNYIKAHGLGEKGLDMVLHCKSHPELKSCWKEIGAALPWRPHQSVYYRAHVLFERAEKRKWTPEEKDFIRRVHEQRGADWKAVADFLGKHRFHVKDTWRRIKLPNMRTGHWSQEEYQTLFDLVNTDLQMKAFEEKKSKHGMLRDNICWEAISGKLSTRSNATCCQKWYEQLTSPMVKEGKWSDADDYRLLNALFTLDACCVEDVDWDNLIDHRPGEICRKRWNQMVNHLGEHGNKSFAEQVEVLSQRYCPNILEAREAYDSKPVFP